MIAEISSNHGQRFEAAVELVRGAHAAGADAVKLQTYTPDTITIDSDSPAFVSGTGSLWEGTPSMPSTRRPTCRGSGSPS